jgi:hypothetical protein
MTEKTSETIKKKVMSKAELEEALINNFTNLQKVLTNLALKFDDLSNNMSKMLQLFEISAKSFAEKYTPEATKSSDKEFLQKLDSLLDQNKTIAKGIMMMEEKIRNRNTGQIIEERLSQQMDEKEDGFNGMIKSRPLPRF